MDNSNWQIKVEDRMYSGNLGIYIWRRVSHGGFMKTEVMFSDKIVTYAEGDPIEDKPSLIMSHAALQDLANAIDKFGIKPQRGFLEGKVEAQGRHLEDMRKLVFNEKVEENFNPDRFKDLGLLKK